MKIDFDMIEKMVDAGASGAVILALLRAQYERKGPRRAKDKVRKRDAKVRKDAESEWKPSEQERNEATLSDTPRARLFREGKPALLTLKIADGRAGALIAQWLKLTNDDEQLVLATILKAQSLAVADAPSWILATLRGKTDERSGSVRTNSGAQQSGSTAVLAGVAAAAERRARERNPAGRDRQAPPDDDSSARPDPELFGTG
jgi:hypothetical protein